MREEAEDEVGRGEIEYQKIAWTSHVRVGEHDVAHEPVAGCSERDQSREQNDQDHLRSVQTAAS